MTAFHEDWFGVEACAALADLTRRVQTVEGRIVEIGSWEGRSTITLANAVHPRPVHAVDTWQGSPGEISSELAAERDVFNQFSTNINKFTRGNVDVHRMGWREYRELSDDPVALLFIDAEHTYREVFDTIEAFGPLMTPGGIMCGDDAHHPPVLAAATEWFPDLYINATLWITEVT